MRETLSALAALMGLARVVARRLSPRMWLAGIAAVTLVVALTWAYAGRGPSAARSVRPTATATQASAPTATVDPWTTEALSVRGTRIVNTHGQPVTLLGAARYSLEFECRGDGHFTLADFQAMRAWGMNTVRFPLSSGFWRNVGAGCPTYQATVASAVATAEAAGLYVILDLQRDAPFSYAADAKHGGAQCPLPDATTDVAFWKAAASAYKNDPRVLFDLFGEPHDISWYQWFHGGAITSSCFGYPQAATYTAIGMPALAADVRAVAPRNLIILSGLAWGYDLSGLSSVHAVAVPNVLYGTHPWGHPSVQRPSVWDRAFGKLARALPVIATEFGQYDCQTSYIAPEISYFERLRLSFLAWAWTPGKCSTPGLLAAWSGAPTTPYGAYIRDQMLQAAKANPGDNLCYSCH